MAWLEKRGETFRIQFRFGGKPRQVALKTGDEAAAKRCLSRFEDTLGDVHRGRLVVPDGADIGLFLLSDGKIDRAPAKPDPEPAPETTAAGTVGDLFALYQTHLTPGAKEENTRRCEAIHLRHLTRVLGGGLALAEVTTAAVQRYVDVRTAEKYHGKPINPVTVRKEVATLVTVWNWGHRRGHAAGACPTKGVTFPKGKEKPPFRTYDQVTAIVSRGGITKTEARSLWDGLFLSTTEVDEVLALVRTRATAAWLSPFVVTAAHTGARRGELLRARVEDFDFDNRVVTLREKKRCRTRVTLRTVDMTPRVAEAVRAYLSGGHPGGMLAFGTRPNVPISDGDSRKAFRAAVRGTKWAVLRGYHVFRHSFASNLAAAGIDEHVIASLMGHLTAEMRARYRHLFPYQRRSAVSSVYG
jgi:integrase